MDDYLSMLGFKITYVSKMGPRWHAHLFVFPFTHHVDLRIYCFQASLPDSRPPPVCFSPPGEEYWNIHQNVNHGEKGIQIQNIYCITSLQPQHNEAIMTKKAGIIQELFNSLFFGRCGCDFEIQVGNWRLEHFMWNFPWVNVTSAINS